jgi:hypothetical protein
MHDSAYESRLMRRPRPLHSLAHIHFLGSFPHRLTRLDATLRICHPLSIHIASQVASYPTILFYPAGTGAKKQPRVYRGPHTVADLAHFVNAMRTPVADPHPTRHVVKPHDHTMHDAGAEL